LTQAGAECNLAAGVMKRQRLTGAIVLAVIAALSAAGYLGYVRGDRRHHTVTSRAGRAYATSVQAVVQTGGWSYNVRLDVPGIDPTGIEHDGSRPACLRAYRQTLIHFGTVNVTLPSGGSQRSVVWVQC
jgi:hypothetical protein